MSKPIFAEADLIILKELILTTLKKEDNNMPADKRKKLMEIYHRMGRTNKPTTMPPLYAPDAPWIKND